MIPKILTGVALAFAVISLILKLVAVSVPHFVDVHFVNDTDDIADGNVIAGVGVYQSIYDPTGEDIAAAIAAAGLPGEVIESATTDFDLLFPAQTNFQAQLLPVGLEEAAALDVTLGNENNEILNALTPSIEAVEAVEFEGCEEYLGEGLVAGTAYFTAVQNEVIPNAVAAITEEIAAGILADPNFELLRNGITNAANSPVGVLPVIIETELFPAAAQVNAQLCGPLLNVNGTADLEANFDATCFAIGIAAGKDFFTNQADAPATLGFVNAIEEIGTVGGAGFTTIQDLIDAVSAAFLFDPATGGGAMGAPPVFFATNLIAVVCDFVACGQNVKALYLVQVIQFLAEQVELGGPNETLEAAIGALLAYTNLFGSGSTIVDAGTTFLTELTPVPANEQESELPARFDEFYRPCQNINDLNSLINALDPPPACFDLTDFLPQVVDVLVTLDNPLAPLVASIADIYEGCALGSNETNICPQVVFAPGLIGATLGVDPSLDFGNEFVAACEDDETDRDAVATAQGLVGFSAALNVIAVILIIISFFLFPRIFWVVGTVVAVLGGIFIIAGLLVVRGAPVYEGVGEEPEGGDPEPIFVEGYVALLALVDALLSFFTGILLAAAAITDCACGEGANEYEDVEGKKDEKENPEEMI